MAENKDRINGILYSPFKESGNFYGYDKENDTLLCIPMLEDGTPDDCEPIVADTFKGDFEIISFLKDGMMRIYCSDCGQKYIDLHESDRLEDATHICATCYVKREEAVQDV